MLRRGDVSAIFVWVTSSVTLILCVVLLLLQEEVLEQQQVEREDSSFHHACMFCSQEFTGNRCCTPFMLPAFSTSRKDSFIVSPGC